MTFSNLAKSTKEKSTNQNEINLKSWKGKNLLSFVDPKGLNDIFEYLYFVISSCLLLLNGKWEGRQWCVAVVGSSGCQDWRQLPVYCQQAACQSSRPVCEQCWWTNENKPKHHHDCFYELHLHVCQSFNIVPSH